MKRIVSKKAMNRETPVAEKETWYILPLVTKHEGQLL